MTNEPQPISATVYQEDGRWWVRITDAQGNDEVRGPISWDGTGSFYNEGLNAVRPWIPKGYAYTSWQEPGDGSYVAVLGRMWPGFD
jgi:hypothetical protein